MQSTQYNIFIYGTLKRGGSNHSLLAGQRFVAIAKTLPIYKLYALNGFPGMVEEAENGRSIEGEIWSIDSACIARLDELEDIAHALYARVPIQLLPPHDTFGVEGYIYLLDVTGRPDCGVVWTE